MRLQTLALGSWMALASCAQPPPMAAAITAAQPLPTATTAPAKRPRRAPTERKRNGLLVVLTACWYVAPPGSTAQTAPEIDPAHCRSVGRRVVTDFTTAEELDFVERLTVADVVRELLGDDDDSDQSP